MDLKIVYEDAHLLAVNKPAGVAAVPGPHVSKDVLMLLGRPGTFVLHRLDRKTSGVLLVGKDLKNRPILEKIISSPSTVKTYLALVKGVFSPLVGTISAALPARHAEKLVSAVTEYETLRAFENVSLISAKIKTGRFHQIRLHCAKMGHPVVNDGEHGDFGWNKKFQRKCKSTQMFLHAHSIEFDHPLIGTHVKIEVPLPDKLEKILRNL